MTTAPEAGVYPQLNVTDFAGVYDLVETRQVGERIPHVAVARSEVLWSGVGTTRSPGEGKGEGRLLDARAALSAILAAAVPAG